jgi:uncharacterized protein (DUF1499 family)
MSTKLNLCFKSLFLSLLLVSLNACMIFPLEVETTDRSLNWCPPLHNCASTEASTFVHSIQPFKLKQPLEKAWPTILQAVESLPGTQIEHQYLGYIYAKSYSDFFKFVDYIEVLAIPGENRLNVRSSSLLGLTDMFVNYYRTELLREDLEEKGVIHPKN